MGCLVSNSQQPENISSLPSTSQQLNLKLVSNCVSLCVCMGIARSEFNFFLKLGSNQRFATSGGFGVVEGTWETGLLASRTYTAHV